MSLSHLDTHEGMATTEGANCVGESAKSCYNIAIICCGVYRLSGFESARPMSLAEYNTLKTDRLTRAALEVGSLVMLMMQISQKTTAAANDTPAAIKHPARINLPPTEWSIDVEEVYVSLLDAKLDAYQDASLVVSTDSIVIDFGPIVHTCGASFAEGYFYDYFDDQFSPLHVTKMELTRVA